MHSHNLGPRGPLPDVALVDPLQRQWLHYAFFDTTGQSSVIANVASLAGADGRRFDTAVLLHHDVTHGWSSSEWNAQAPVRPWSSFDTAAPDDALRIADVRGEPGLELTFRRTSTPCSSQCASFHDTHWMRWQSEPGVVAEGSWWGARGGPRRVQAVGYHERVRGRWGWPQMGGWVFGFCNVLGADGGPPEWATVFTLLQPAGRPDETAASVMVWRQGRHIRHFPRRQLAVSVAGQLDRDQVTTVPHLAALLGTTPSVPIPAALSIVGAQGRDRITMSFRARSAARLVVPSETSERPWSVHEVVGDVVMELELGGKHHAFQGPGVVEFAGAADRRTDHAW